ncbi:MAG: arylsulfatase, partial [Acidobacteriota bacterium]
RDRYEFYPGAAVVPESAGPRVTGRSYKIAAGVSVDSDKAEGVLWAAGGIPGGHSLYIKDGHLRYSYNWVGSTMQDVTADAGITQGDHVYAAEFTLEGPSKDEAMPGAEGTLTLYCDDEEIGSGRIITQPGAFCLTGDGICAGRDSSSAVTPAYEAPYPFTGGKLDKVVVDVSGEPYIDHEAEVRTWFAID